MKEFASVRQHEGEAPRRWFSDEYFDLIVWGVGGELSAFHLAYDKRRDERVIAWRRERGLSHFRVDSAGDRPARHARTAFLTPEPADDLTGVIERFERVSAGIDPEIAAAVLSRLRGQDRR